MYRIKYNTWTKTYYVYRVNKSVQLRKDKTKSMKEFMKNHECKDDHSFIVWQ